LAVKVFEELPLYVQIEVIGNHVAIYGDELDLSEYFYQFRKLWKDMEHRIRENRFESEGKKQSSGGAPVRRQRYLERSLRGLKKSMKSWKAEITNPPCE